MKMGFKKIVFGFFVITIGLLASIDYEEGVKYYENGNYSKAFPILKKV